MVVGVGVVAIVGFIVVGVGVVAIVGLIVAGVGVGGPEAQSNVPRIHRVLPAQPGVQIEGGATCRDCLRGSVARGFKPVADEGLDGRDVGGPAVREVRWVGGEVAVALGVVDVETVDDAGVGAGAEVEGEEGQWATAVERRMLEMRMMDGVSEAEFAMVDAALELEVSARRLW